MGQKLYAVPNSTAILLVEDAYKNREKDSLLADFRHQHRIDSMLHRIQVSGLKMQINNCGERVDNLRKQLTIQSQIPSDNASEIDIYKKSSRRYRRQRNIIAGFLILVAGAAIANN